MPFCLRHTVLATPGIALRPRSVLLFFATCYKHFKPKTRNWPTFDSIPCKMSNGVLFSKKSLAVTQFFSKAPEKIASAQNVLIMSFKCSIERPMPVRVRFMGCAVPFCWGVWVPASSDLIFCDIRMYWNAESNYFPAPLERRAKLRTTFYSCSNRLQTYEVKVLLCWT